MKIDSYLRQKNISGADLARAIGKSRATAHRIITGERLPDRESMQAIYKFTGGAVTANDFYGLVGKQNSRLSARQSSGASGEV